MHTEHEIDHLKAQSRERPLDRRDFMRALTFASAAGFRRYALAGASA